MTREDSHTTYKHTRSAAAGIMSELRRDTRRDTRRVAFNRKHQVILFRER